MRRRLCCLAVMLGMLTVVSSCSRVEDTSNSPFQVKNTRGDQSSVTEEIGKTEEAREQQHTGNTEEQLMTPETDRPLELSELYKSYQQILMDHESDIRRIDWQTRSYMSEEGLDFFSGYGYLEDRIAFYDLTGDGVDEMIVMYGVLRDGEDDCYMADVDIYGSLNGSVQSLFHQDSYEVQVAGGSRTAMFAMSDNQFLIYDSMGDEMWETDYTVYTWLGSGFVETETYSYHTTPNEDYTETLEDYYEDEREITANEFVSHIQSYSDRIQALLLQDMIDDEVVYYMAESVPDQAVTYDQAIAYLNVWLSYCNGTPAGDVLFSQVAGEYYFSSGAGGWGTELALHEDGTFDGTYHDSDMGDMGDEYPNGTVYVSNFTGRFKNPVAISDGVYAVELDYLDYEGLGNVEFLDGVRYIYSEPYGIAGSDIFEIYPVGAPTKDLPQDYLDWISMPRAWGDDIPETLPFNGIYNVMEKEGFGQ